MKSAKVPVVEAKLYKAEKRSRINVDAVEAIGEKFASVNKYIQAGVDIPAELTRNFVTVPLSDDPYSEIP